MFYGSGAGKLPTASAVVGDLVAMAKHINKNIYLEWSEEKLELANPSQQSYRFFVRTKDSKEKVESIFHKVEFVDAGIQGETAFVTCEMTQKKYDDASAGIDLIQMIRFA